jgi:hypothetical protein
MHSRGLFLVHFLYMGVLVLALAEIGVSLTVMMQGATELSQQVQQNQDRTFLDLRLQSSREIRQALAKPLPPLEPLPPIPARLAHAGSRVVVFQPVPRRLTQTASDALASGQEWFSSSRTSAYAEFDRHAYQ